MTPILDPREGDFEDDVSSTKTRSLLSLLGSLLVEISLPKLVLCWGLLIGVPGLLLGAIPVLFAAWAASVSAKIGNLLTDVLPALLLVPLLAAAWFGGRPLFHLAESSFWSLNALLVQPGYIAAREMLRHFAERPLGERLSDEVMELLHVKRTVETASLSIGGGVGFPTTPADRAAWADPGPQRDRAAPLAR